MSERRIIAQHAGTVLVGQLAVMAFGITDTLVAGRYDTQALAALSVGSNCIACIFCLNSLSNCCLLDVMVLLFEVRDARTQYFACCFQVPFDGFRRDF